MGEGATQEDAFADEIEVPSLRTGPLPPGFSEAVLPFVGRYGTEIPTSGAYSIDTLPPPAPRPPSLVPPPVIDHGPWATGMQAMPAPTIGMAMVLARAAMGPEPERPIASAPGVERAQREASKEVLLLGFVPGCAARLRKVPAWRSLIERMQRHPLDQDVEQDDGGEEPRAGEDPCAVHEVLEKGAPADAKGVEDARGEARRAGVRLAPPLVLLEGEVEVHFDEMESLRSATEVAALLVDADSTLRETVERASRFLQSPGVEGRPTLAAALTAHMRDLIARKTEKPPMADPIAQMDMDLLCSRYFQRRSVFGGTHLRCTLRLCGAKGPLVAYVPQSLAPRLPLLRRFPARLVAEVHPPLDEREASRHALRALALGRVMG
jgi:hypothetical protein